MPVVHQETIVSEVSGWLRVYDNGSVDRTWTGSPDVKLVTTPVPPHSQFVNGVATADVTINPESDSRVRIYLPERLPSDQKKTKLPIILHFHGGGFCISQADWYIYYSTYANLAKSVPAIIVSVYLQLAPENRLPAAINDGFQALLWLKRLAQADSHEPWLNEHGDFNRVFLIGDSSGGNIVHQVAARAGDVDISPLRLAGAIPIHPGIVRSERSRSELENPETPFLTLEMVDKFLSLALPIGSTKDHPYTCPMGAGAPKMEGLNLPPFLVCVAEKDLMVDTNMEYYEALKKAKKDVELLTSPGIEHCFYLNRVAVDTNPNTAYQTSELFEGISEFIRKH